MSRYQNRQELANHADWEGGVLEFVFGYGVSVEDLPEDDQELRGALTELLAVEPIIDRFVRLLPEPGEEE